MYCSNCGTECNGNAKFCSNCGQAIFSESKDEIAVKTITKWEASGKVSVVRHPITKNKQPLEGEWKYDKGEMKRKTFLKSQTIDLRNNVLEVELAAEPIALVAGLKKSVEITPALLTLGTASPLLMMAHSEKKTKLLQEKVLMDITLKDGTAFLAFTTAEVLAEIMSNTISALKSDSPQ